MRTIGMTIAIIIGLALSIILLPFRLLDYITIGFWRNRKVKAWRKNPKVGDKVYFINALGNKTEAVIENIDRADKKNRGAQIVSKTFSSTAYQWMELDRLHPSI